MFLLTGSLCVLHTREWTLINVHVIDQLSLACMIIGRLEVQFLVLKLVILSVMFLYYPQSIQEIWLQQFKINQDDFTQPAATILSYTSPFFEGVITQYL
jgi:hypothetical protein